MKKKLMKLFGKSLLRRRNKKQTPSKDRVIFVSHEATRTGAPKIILNLLSHFASNCDVHCETILQSGGHLASDFQRYSEVDCFNVPSSEQELLKKRVERFVDRYTGNKPILAVCNSMESRFIANTLSELDIPVVSLVHELPSSYAEDDYRYIFDASKKVVFPVHAVRDAADAKTPLPQGKSLVLSQGLLNPEFGTGISREQAYKKIRQELGLPDNAFIALGCGTLDLRKGIDHYAAIARRVAQTNHSSTPIHFVWVGEGHRWTHSPYHYVQLDIDKSNAKNYVHFIGERENVEPYFVGSDCFVMSSRVDPFPCVIHEAMASSLPVITFANSGGAPEAVDNGAGIIVPYADYDQAAASIRLLADQPEIAAGIRQRSLERVRTRYRFDEYADKVIDLCESVINRNLRQRAQLQIHRAA
ncbi:MAG: glycosyltransferase family 4 protein [Planctomycetota bacterium]